jgi:hypothetical protein
MDKKKVLIELSMENDRYVMRVIGHPDLQYTGTTLREALTAFDANFGMMLMRKGLQELQKEEGDAEGKQE